MWTSFSAHSVALNWEVSLLANEQGVRAWGLGVFCGDQVFEFSTHGPSGSIFAVWFADRATDLPGCSGEKTLRVKPKDEPGAWRFSGESGGERPRGIKPFEDLLKLVEAQDISSVYHLSRILLLWTFVIVLFQMNIHLEPRPSWSNRSPSVAAPGRCLKRLRTVMSFRQCIQRPKRLWDGVVAGAYILFSYVFRFSDGSPH